MATLENGYAVVDGAVVAIERTHCRKGLGTMGGGGMK